MLKSIQAGRGLAALSVCAFHLSKAFADKRFLNAPVFEEFTWRGNLGVDFFFVLSGFIIMFAHREDIGHPEAISRFIYKRVVRIFPVYLLYSAIFLFLIYFGFGDVSNLPKTISDWVSTIMLIKLSSFTPPINPSWTLIHEVAFYAVFITLLLNRVFGVLAFAAWAVLIVLYQFFGFIPKGPVFDTYFSIANFDFIIGMFSYHVWKRGAVFEGVVCGVVGGVAMTIGFVLQQFGADLRILWPVFGIGFGGCLVGVAMYESRHPRIKLTLLTALGGASYTIYLVHEHIMSVSLKIVYGSGIHRYISPGATYLLVFLITVFVCYLSYKFIEVPLSKFVRQRFEGGVSKGNSGPL
jgi:exopolysaccharide production protein ExoZ